MLRAQPDDRLLALARDGNECAFEALVERYRKPLVAHARYLLPAARAEDAVQQGLFQAWLALHRGTYVRDVRPWLYRVVHNSAISMRRSLRDDHAPLTDTLAAPGTPHSDLERQIAARDALEQVAALPGLQREVMLQTAVGGRTRDQVATALGLSDGAVRGLLYRARTTLRAAATCLIPSPIVTGAIRLIGKHPPSAEAPPGAGSTTGVGIAAAVAKGGAVAVTVGVLAVGGRAVHSHLWPDHTRRADNHGYGHNHVHDAVATPMTRHRVEAVHAGVGGAGSTRRVMVRSTASSAVSHVPVHLTSSAASPAPEPTRPGLVQSAAPPARAVGTIVTLSGGGLTSVTQSNGSNGGGSAAASTPPPRTSASQAPTSPSTGGDGEQGNAGSASGASGSAAAPAATAAPAAPAASAARAAPAAPAAQSDASTVSASEDDSSTGAPSPATGSPNDGGDGSTTSQPAAPQTDSQGD